jgi:hypothetical protein
MAAKLELGKRYLIRPNPSAGVVEFTAAQLSPNGQFVTDGFVWEDLNRLVVLDTLPTLPAAVVKEPEADPRAANPPETAKVETGTS